MTWTRKPNPKTPMDTVPTFTFTVQRWSKCPHCTADCRLVREYFIERHHTRPGETCPGSGMEVAL